MIKEIQHKIHVLKLNQSKIKDESKSLATPNLFVCLVEGIKMSRQHLDEQHEYQKQKFVQELQITKQKENITNIIHETYVKELARIQTLIGQNKQIALEEAERLQMEQLALAKRLAHEKKLAKRAAFNQQIVK